MSSNKNYCLVNRFTFKVFRFIFRRIDRTMEMLCHFLDVFCTAVFADVRCHKTMHLQRHLFDLALRFGMQAIAWKGKPTQFLENDRFNLNTIKIYWKRLFSQTHARFGVTHTTLWNVECAVPKKFFKTPLWRARSFTDMNFVLKRITNLTITKNLLLFF